MAQINFNEINFNENSNQNNRISFFGLKNDGDEAIVRIMHDSIEDFDICTVHKIQIGKSFRNINCLRSAQEPVEKCPLCEAGVPITNRMFVHLIHYVRDENGILTAIPKMWDRSISYAQKLAGFINEYGPLSEVIFKIKRRGAAGSRDTDYDIMFCNPAMYNESMYPKNQNAFEKVTASTTNFFVVNKTFDQMLAYVSTGSFPEKEKEPKPESSQSQYNSTISTKSYGDPAPQTYASYQPQGPANPEYVRQDSRSYEAPSTNEQPPHPATPSTPSSTPNTNEFSRPRRFY